jgi:hypothetical protein
MRRDIALLAVMSVAFFCSCGKKESGEAPKPAAEAPAAAQPIGGPHAFVHLTDGSKVPGTVVASSKEDMVVAGDDGIERRIPLDRIKSVEFSDAQKTEPERQATRQSKPPKTSARESSAPAQQQPSQQTAQETAQPSSPAPPATPAATARTYELPSGTEISVRTNETIDSKTAAEGQTFDVQVTRDARDANGDVVIPRGSEARLAIKSASKGGRFRGASDLVLDLQSVNIHGRPYRIDAADISEKGKSGLGANKRTATYTGGGAALGAIIGAIAGGGKGAAIGAGAGAGAGALTQVLTKGGSIKVPAETVLTFRLDSPLKVTAAE